MRKLLTFFIFAVTLYGQGQSFSWIKFLNSGGTKWTQLQSPSALGTNQTITLWTVGSAGCVYDSGAGILSITSCSGGVTSVGLSMPSIFTVSGSPVTGTGTLTAALNSQTANLFLASPNGSTGAPSFRSIVTADVPTGTSGATIPLLSTTNLWTNTQSFSDKAQSGGVAGAGTCSYPGALSLPCWYNDQKGIATAQNVTSRYTFNSMADQVAAGTFSASGATITNLGTGTATTFDLSWVGGQILLCSTTCTTSNGTLYQISAYVDSTHLTLATSPGFSGAFSYAANAFQTSQGTMYGTGSGFWYMQNAVVTNGFTSYGGGTVTGNLHCGGTNLEWMSGSQFTPDMLGGGITFNVYTFQITNYLTPTRVTITPSCTPHGGTGNFSYVYSPDPFRLISSGTRLAYTDTNGNIYGQTLNAIGAANGPARFGSGQVYPSTIVLSSGDVSGFLPHANIANTTVTPGSYTNASITVQADGTITTASNGAAITSVTPSCSGCSGLGTFTKESAGVAAMPSGCLTVHSGMTTPVSAIANQYTGGATATEFYSASFSSSDVIFCSSIGAASTALISFSIKGN